MKGDWNFCDNLLTTSMADQLFGPLEEGEEIRFIDSAVKLEHLAVIMGVFPSVTQARKNGWQGELPTGYNEMRRGKRVFYLYILPENCRELYRRYRRRFK